MSDALSSGLPAEVRRLRFLVAENNPALQKSIVNRLSDAGVDDCHAVSSGQEAFKVWRQSGRVGVVIASVKLEELGGIEFLKHVRADKEAGLQPAFIVMSDDDGLQAAESAVSEGADCFVLKPFPLGSLNALVGEAVEHRKKIAGRDCFLRMLETSGGASPIRAVLTHERQRKEMGCEMLSGAKCVILVDHNYGLGTVLEISFMRPAEQGEGTYLPIKGQVTKMERVPGQFLAYRVHLQFSTAPTDEHGIRDLLLAEDNQ